MNLYPAIDLKDGNCVRLLRGEMDAATVFNDDPGAQAAQFVKDGCEWVHIVDLNGAFEGKPVNEDAVIQIVTAVDGKAQTQLGGGIRTFETIKRWLDLGISRVILGTIALRDPDFVIEACKRFPGQVAVGIDARDGYVAVEGWAEVSEVKTLDLALKFEDAGVAAIIFTDISRDGAMQGPNLEATNELAAAISTPVILSGGVSSMDDINTIKEKGVANLDGAISGRAIYDGKINVAEAMKVLKG
ncbi:1-(5-phosphoribosyl)-5-[(5-phosphoribosylamino) methylideneamino] imidazole-4-carboxamide isomerase [Terasakiella brassicae]|uniref:1-(5-phosphoribosyl)-5-[(5-phosphoribosylamino)methylideneamino] imidazole-4-carboxamide isomerase n=1 Tax=Terasakiella brassicae TaxID=1634917 RepID=A0A917FA29_9PROT|nr:1-(5-phosphoribosyl)-5-[(5-phosphoribosylamino)methylideneamino]imidazole-4-carboxamide isomerase [Terasakiella brassicae]GGF59632.1 1-(5-phosphoribosyl)-5-[(5-phosphoribosylamino) methylideneamino] imidazole-4-carboxamide isomerase [Terasakiella brassicae]